MALTRIPAPVNKQPASVNAQPSGVSPQPSHAGLTRVPDVASSGNTTNVVAVGATGATTTAINDANNKIQVGA